MSLLPDDVTSAVMNNPEESSFRLKSRINKQRTKLNQRRARNDNGKAKSAGIKLVSREEVRKAIFAFHRRTESVRLQNHKHQAKS